MPRYCRTMWHVINKYNPNPKVHLHRDALSLTGKRKARAPLPAVTLAYDLVYTWIVFPFGVYVIHANCKSSLKAGNFGAKNKPT